MDMKIGILDSGIGGLTVLKQLINLYPNNEYIYFGDTINMPYGEKTQQEVIGYGNNIIKFLESQDVDIIIIACGTLSNNINYLNSNKKLVSLLPFLNNKLDKYREVSIMATPLSIKSNIYEKYIHTKLDLIPCYDLAGSIEHNDEIKIEKLVKKYVSDIKGDVLLLGCTHYPIVKNVIKKYYKGVIMGLDDFIFLNISNDGSFKLKIYFSLISDNLLENIKKILSIENVDLESRIL